MSRTDNQILLLGNVRAATSRSGLSFSPTGAYATMSHSGLSLRGNEVTAAVAIMCSDAPLPPYIQLEVISQLLSCIFVGTSLPYLSYLQITFSLYKKDERQPSSHLMVSLVSSVERVKNLKSLEVSKKTTSRYVGCISFFMINYRLFASQQI